MAKKRKGLIKKPISAKKAETTVANKPRRLNIWKIKNLLVVALLIGFVALSLWIFWDIPLPDKLSQNQPVSTQIFDRNGELIYEIYASERRTPIDLTQIPEHLKQATIAIEDKDFYNHSGFSITGIGRAAIRTISGEGLEGGSTLTQQLVKNALLTPERTVRRKIREFALSLMVEARYSKDEILNMYLNQIPYGSTAYGVEAAARMYFAKSAKELTLSESALLAGLPVSPTRLSPFGTNPDRAFERQRVVLRRMVEDGYISQEEADKAAEEKLTFASQENFKAPHFSLWIKEQLAEKFGDTVVEQGGLRVTTTLDLSLQELAQQAVATEVAKLTKQKVGNGAAIVTNPKTGEILAMVGSKDYFAKDEDGKVNIILANRQPGSSIKPLTYALGLKEGVINLSTPLADVPTCFTVVGQPAYCPQNYSGTFSGSAQVRFALANSLNIPAVRVIALTGVSNFVSFARDMGLSSLQNAENYGLSLTLGGGEVRPIDMATAYGVLANWGTRKDLISITKVVDWKGEILLESKISKDPGPRLLPEEVGFLVSHALYDNNARSAVFGTSSFLNVRGYPQVAVKTGTTNDRRDNWTVGYTPQAVVVVWVGNNDNSPMSGAVSGVSGASPIWNKVMRETLERARSGKYDEADKNKIDWPKTPANIEGASICANTGYVVDEASGGCPERFEYFTKGSIPKNGARRQDVFFDRTTGKSAEQNSLPENLEPRNELVVIDPLGTILCLTCSFPPGTVNIPYPLRN